jgi:phage gp29-like protein
VLDTKNTYGWGAYLKILCVCVDGEDLTKRFGNFTLSSEIASGFNGDIDTALQSALRKIRDAETDEEAGKIAATFARKLIRTCYSLVMTRAQVWTTKLSEQADVFIQYFPEKRAFVRTLQDWVVQPPHNSNDEERKKRLISRGQSDLANQKMLDWAEYLRNEVVTIPGAIIFDTSSLQIEEAVTKLWQVMNKN